MYAKSECTDQPTPDQGIRLGGRFKQVFDLLLYRILFTVLCIELYLGTYWLYIFSLLNKILFTARHSLLADGFNR